MNGDKSGPRISEQISLLINKIDMKFPKEETQFDQPIFGSHGVMLSESPEFYAADFWSIRLWLKNRLHDKKTLSTPECLLILGFDSIMFRNFHVCKDRSRDTLKKSFLTSQNFNHGIRNADGEIVYPNPSNGVMGLNFYDVMGMDLYPAQFLPYPLDGLEVHPDLSKCIRLKSTAVADADFIEAAKLVDSIPPEYRPNPSTFGL